MIVAVPLLDRHRLRADRAPCPAAYAFHHVDQHHIRKLLGRDPVRCRRSHISCSNDRDLLPHCVPSPLGKSNFVRNQFSPLEPHTSLVHQPQPHQPCGDRTTRPSKLRRDRLHRPSSASNMKRSSSSCVLVPALAHPFRTLPPHRLLPWLPRSQPSSPDASPARPEPPAQASEPVHHLRPMHHLAPMQRLPRLRIRSRQQSPQNKHRCCLLTTHPTSKSQGLRHKAGAPLTTEN